MRSSQAASWSKLSLVAEPQVDLGGHSKLLGRNHGKAKRHRAVDLLRLFFFAQTKTTAGFPGSGIQHMGAQIRRLAEI